MTKTIGSFLAGVLLVLSAVLWAGCAGGTPSGESTPTSGAGTTVPPITSTTTRPSTTLFPTTSPSSTSTTIVPLLSPAQLAGQRIIYSYPGLTPPEELFTLIKHGEVGGIIFFAENVSSREQIHGVIERLSEANDDPGNPVRAPLLLMIDQEGGLVRHLPGEPVSSEKEIGASDDPAAAAAAAGAAAATNLRDAGMNVDLAPVLDVYRAEGGFDDRFERSYSMKQSVVSEAGASFIGALQAGGVAATAKHFPGLGAASRTQDTDLRPVALDVVQTSLRKIDEYPYAAAISSGVRLVMMSWAIYPALDADLPAGFSRTIVQGELRGRLGFEGVTITDAITAGALKAYGSVEDRAVLAAKAGVDLILCSARDLSEGKSAQDGLEKGVSRRHPGEGRFPSGGRTDHHLAPHPGGMIGPAHRSTLGSAPPPRFRRSIAREAWVSRSCRSDCGAPSRK